MTAKRGTSRIIICTNFYYAGGTLVLSQLCKCLRSLGYDARLLPLDYYPTDYENPDDYLKRFRKAAYKSTIKCFLFKLFPVQWLYRRLKYDNYYPIHLRGCCRQWLPFWPKNTVVLYPESLYGNPLKAKNIVRWQLYHYKHWGDNRAYSPSDLFMGYREVFNDREHTPDIENVCLNSFDASLYRRYNYGQRSGTCYMIRKGRNRKDLPASFDGAVIDDLTEDEKVRALNECEYCVSYDTQTFYSYVAAICGCHSVVIPEPGKTKADYLTSTEKSNGVAWGFIPGEIERASNTVDDLVEEMRQFENNNLKEAEHFVSIVERYFNVRVRKTL